MTPRTETAPNPATPRAIAFGAVVALMLGGACQSWRTGATEAPVAPQRVQWSLEATPLQQDRVETARIVAESGEYEEALRIFQALLAENPTLTTAFIGIGGVHLARGNYREAEPAFARAVRLEPGNFDAQFGHGRVLQLLERFSEAVRAYHRALMIRPFHVDSNVNIATAYLQMNEPGLAVPFAEKAVDLDPDNGAARSNLGAAYERVGRIADAIRQYEIALELLEPSPPLLLNLMNAYASERRFREAINTGEILVRIAPSANAFERMGFAHFRLGEFDASKRMYRRAIEIEPGHFPSWNGIGVNALNAWLASDRTDRVAMVEARDAFRNSLRINSDQPRVVSLLSRYFTG
jgi:tetratricopeptide (TPR) repeat protein